MGSLNETCVVRHPYDALLLMPRGPFEDVGDLVAFGCGCALT